MSQQDGAALKLFINNTAVTRATNIAFRTEAGIVRIETLEGLAGFANGSGLSGVTFEHPIMIDGHEIDVHGMCARLEYADVQVFMGALSYTGRGKFENAESSQSVGNPANCSASWTGELKAPE
jgi:hypothetical protein